MLKLGEREFDVIKSGTIEWDVTLLNLLSGCGLAEVTMYAGEDAEGLALRVYRTLMASGAVFEILGCVLYPVPAMKDVPGPKYWQDGTLIPLRDSQLWAFTWTPEMMRETAAFLRKLHTPEDKAVITSQIVSLVTGFFQQGLLSMRTFPKSSTLPESAVTQMQPLLPAEISTNGLGRGG